MSLKTVNRALRRIHAASVSNLDGSTEQKRIIADELECAIDYVMRMSGWTEESAIFCPGQADVCDPCCDLPVGFSYAYHLPKDYVRAKRVDPKNTKDPCAPPEIQWRIVKLNGCSVLVTDCDPVKMEYVCRPDDVDALPPDQAEVIKLRLAMMLVQPLNADNSMYAEIKAEFDEAASMAANTSGEHDQEDHFFDDPGELLEARMCSWSGYGSTRGGRY